MAMHDALHFQYMQKIFKPGFSVPIPGIQTTVFINVVIFFSSGKIIAPLSDPVHVTEDTFSLLTANNI